MEDKETSQEATRQLWAVVVAVDNWAEDSPAQVSDAIRRTLADDDLESNSIPARAARVVAFHDGMIGQNETKAKRLGLRLLGETLSPWDTLSQELSFCAYCVGIGVEHRTLCETGRCRLIRDWERVRKHFDLDEDGRKLSTVTPADAGQQSDGNILSVPAITPQPKVAWTVQELGSHVAVVLKESPELSSKAVAQKIAPSVSDATVRKTMAWKAGQARKQIAKRDKVSVEAVPLTEAMAKAASDAGLNPAKQRRAANENEDMLSQLIDDQATDQSAQNDGEKAHAFFPK